MDEEIAPYAKSTKSQARRQRRHDLTTKDVTDDASNRLSERDASAEESAIAVIKLGDISNNGMNGDATPLQSPCIEDDAFGEHIHNLTETSDTNDAEVETPPSPSHSSPKDVHSFGERPHDVITADDTSENDTEDAATPLEHHPNSKDTFGGRLHTSPPDDPSIDDNKDGEHAVADKTNADTTDNDPMQQVTPTEDLPIGRYTFRESTVSSASDGGTGMRATARPMLPGDRRRVRAGSVEYDTEGFVSKRRKMPNPSPSPFISKPPRRESDGRPSVGQLRLPAGATERKKRVTKRRSL